MNFLSLMLQDLSEIILIWWFCAQETFLIIINVENCIIILFRILQWTEMSDNNIINVFTVTFNQFNAPLNKIYIFNELSPKPLTGTVQFKCKSLLVAVLFSSWNHRSFLSFFNVILFFCFCVSHNNYKQMPKITNYISSFHFIIPSDVVLIVFYSLFIPEICFLSQVILLIIKTMLTRFSVPSLHHPICGWVC